MLCIVYVDQRTDRPARVTELLEPRVKPIAPSFVATKIVHTNARNDLIGSHRDDDSVVYVFKCDS